MNKFDYLFESFKHRAYTKKAFLLSIFSIVTPGPKSDELLKKIPFALHRDDEKKEVYFYRDSERVVVEHDDYEKALFHKNDKLTVNGNFNEFIDSDKETTVGIFLANLVVLYESINDAATYTNGPIDGGVIKGFIRKAMVDDPKEGEAVPKGKASVTSCLNITKNLDYLEGLNSVFVKASSPDVLTVHPEVIALRDRLLKELEDQGKLGDPTAVSLVINQVVELDAKIQFSGPSKDFFINKKFIDNARKKMFIIFDMVPDFNTGKYVLLRNSLNEGWDKKHFPEYINTAVSASFDRGNATGEGGAEVKVLILLTNRIHVGGDDCGTTRCEAVTLNKFNFKGWLGSFYVKDGKYIPVADVDKNALLGTTVQMRVPQYCKEPEHNLCYTCCGSVLGAIKNRVSSEVVLIGTQIMLQRMKGMHVSQLKTVTLDRGTLFK